MAASSFRLPSRSSQIPTISSATPQPLPLALSTLFLSSSKPFSSIKNAFFSSSNSFPILRKAPPLGSATVPKVAVPSELQQEEEAAEFSPDLKLFVGNLSFSVDSAQLAGLFQCAGNVEMVEVVCDKMTGKSRGFGFVTMSTIEEVEAAAHQFNGYTLEGRPLRVNSGPPPRDDFQDKGFPAGGNLEAANSVYVGNLSWGIDNLTLEALFSEQGKVLEAKVVYDRESGRSRGFGFVTYSSAEEVDNAIASLNGADLDGRPIRVMVAEPRPRREF